jgi:hypothetical protein
VGCRCRTCVHHRQAAAEAGRGGRHLEQGAGDHRLHHPRREVWASRIRLTWLLKFCTAHSLQHDPVDIGHTHPGDGRTGPSGRVDRVQLGVGRVGHDQGLAVGRGTDAVEVDRPGDRAEGGRRAAERQGAERQSRDPARLTGTK